MCVRVCVVGRGRTKSFMKLWGGGGREDEIIYEVTIGAARARVCVVGRGRGRGGGGRNYLCSYSRRRTLLQMLIKERN